VVQGLFHIKLVLMHFAKVIMQGPPLGRGQVGVQGFLQQGPGFIKLKSLPQLIGFFAHILGIRIHGWLSLYTPYEVVCASPDKLRFVTD
jgi:hypothetical protein